MRKRRIFLLLALCLAIMAILIMGRRPAEDQLAPMLMVDGKLYQLYDFQKAAPEGNPDWEIRQIIGNRLPMENEQANFRYAGMPYWKIHDGICVLVNVNYLLFEVQE